MKPEMRPDSQYSLSSQLVPKKTEISIYNKDSDLERTITFLMLALTSD